MGLFYYNHSPTSALRVGLIQALDVQETFKAAVMKLKIDWPMVALSVFLFGVTVYAQGLGYAGLITASLLYGVSLMALVIAALTAAVTHSRLDRWDWAALLYTVGFMGVSMVANFEPLLFLTVLGAGSGSVVGAYVATLAWRARRD